MFKEKAKGERCLDTGRFGEGHKLGSQSWRFLDSYGFGWVAVVPLQTHTHRKKKRCKFKLIRRDHVGFIKSIKAKAKGLNHWENRHS